MPEPSDTRRGALHHHQGQSAPCPPNRPPQTAQRSQADRLTTLGQPDPARLLDLLEDSTAHASGTHRVLLLADSLGRTTAHPAETGHVLGRTMEHLAEAGYGVLVLCADRHLLEYLQPQAASLDPGSGCPAQGLELLHTALKDLDGKELFQAAFLPTATVIQADRALRAQLIEQAAARLVPGGQLIVATEHVVTHGLATWEYTLDGETQVTDRSDPRTEQRHVIMRHGGETTELRLHLASPASLAHTLAEAGLRLTYQHAEVHPLLPHYRVVVMRAVRR